MPTVTTLRKTLRRYVREGELYRTLDENTLECYACGHRCKIKEGREGICKIRFNERGKLFVPYGYTAGVQVDPIEKNLFSTSFPALAQ